LIRLQPLRAALYVCSLREQVLGHTKVLALIAVTAGVTLVTIDAVVDISRNILVMEVRGIVTAMTGRALEYRIVIRIRVARRANAIGVAMVDRELRVLRVIEGSARPGGRVVAVLARCWEELRLCRVTGVAGVVVVSLMASDASRRQRGVVAVDVAIGAHARWHSMRAGQGEGCVVVVERRVCPYSGVMTELAGGRETGGGMCRIGRAGVVLLMARVAQGAVQRIIVVDVAIGAQARWNRMRAG